MRFLIGLFLASNALALSTVSEEKFYLDYKASFAASKIVAPIAINQKIFVDAVEDALSENPNDQELLQGLANLQSFSLDLLERVRLEILKLKYEQALRMDEGVANELRNELRRAQVEVRLIYTLAAHEEILLRADLEDIVSLAKLHEAYGDITPNSETDTAVVEEVASDLYFNTPDTSGYMNGEYIKGVKIFMFCRQNRLYPCLMVMRDADGREVRKPDGALWTNPALASAVTGLPSYQRNGNTPAGIYTIDSVMPVADQQLSYGKFRRMILNFVPKSSGEGLSKLLIPQSSWEHDWWSQGNVARDIGRSLFRIHGSGRINREPNTPFFPLNRTHGCIAQRENTYDGVTYQDQRDLLDTVMRAMGLEPKYANEPKIKGFLYVMEIDDLSRRVAPEDLEVFGIK